MTSVRHGVITWHPHLGKHFVQICLPRMLLGRKAWHAHVYTFLFQRSSFILLHVTTAEKFGGLSSDA